MYPLKYMHSDLFDILLLFCSGCFFFFFGHVACGVLVSLPGIEPIPPSLEAQSLNHWTARKSPLLQLKKKKIVWGIGDIFREIVSLWLPRKVI